MRAFFPARSAMLAAALMALPIDPALAQRPLWSWRMPSFPTNQGLPVRDVRAIGPTILVIAPPSVGLVAVDQRTGRVRWRKSPPVNAPGRPNAGQPGDEFYDWRFLGADGRLAVMHLTISRPPKLSRAPWITHTQIMALDARSGRVSWRRHLPPDYPDEASWTVLADLLIEREHWKYKHVRFRSVRTGDEVDPASPEGHKRLSAASKRLGTSRVLIPALFPLVLDLPAGTTQELPLQGAHSVMIYGVEEPAIAQMGDRALAVLDSDDGRVGHSSWPKFLSLIHLGSFHEQWRFRKDVVWDYKLEQPKEGTGSRLQLARALPASSVAVVQEAWNSWLHGISLRDGQRLWSRKFAGLSVNGLAACGRNLLVLADPEDRPKTGPGRSTLLLIDPKTGRTVRTISTPPTMYLRVDGGGVYTWGLAGVDAWRESDLVSAVSGKPIRRSKSFH